jgi:hypothetical protein
MRTRATNGHFLFKIKQRNSLFMSLGENKFQNCGHQRANGPSSRWYVSMKLQWNDTDRGRQELWELPVPFLLFHTNRMCTDWSVNPGLHSDKLVTNRLRHGTARIYWCSAYEPMWYTWVWRHSGALVTSANRKTRRETCPSITSSTTNPTWTVPGENQGLSGDRSASNRVKHGTAQRNLYSVD